MLSLEPLQVELYLAGDGIVHVRERERERERERVRERDVGHALIVDI
jgi:hypothetical protein